MTAALFIFILSWPLLIAFTAGAMKASQRADDEDEALIQRILDGDPRLASLRDDLPHDAPDAIR